jgi:DNA polymerase/3'-5' exonuclease PolX
MDNNTVACRLLEHARELDAEGGNLLRVRAYRIAAQTIAELDEPVATFFEAAGRRGLRTLPGIGPHLARAIESLLLTGRLPPRRSVRT